MSDDTPVQDSPGQPPVQPVAQPAAQLSNQLSNQLSTMTSSAGGWLVLAALLFLADYVVFEVALNTFSMPTLGTITAVLILIGQYRATGPAAGLGTDGAKLVLGLVLALEALVFLIYDIRGAYVDFGDIADLIAQVGHYAAGAIAAVGVYRLMR